MLKKFKCAVLSIYVEDELELPNVERREPVVHCKQPASAYMFKSGS
jgi:hypothetical protein